MYFAAMLQDYISREPSVSLVYKTVIQVFFVDQYQIGHAPSHPLKLLSTTILYPRINFENMKPKSTPRFKIMVSVFLCNSKSDLQDIFQGFDD